jgi:hypothetical protein
VVKGKRLKGGSLEEMQRARVLMEFDREWFEANASW